MLQKIIKITLKSSKKNILFVFLAVFLSLFSYILGTNIILSVNEYIKGELKVIVGGDIVLSSRNNDIDEALFSKYENDFDITKTIELDFSIFDKNKNPKLVELVYHKDNFPFYNQFEYDLINENGSLLVSKKIYDDFGDNLEIFGQDLQIKGIIIKSPLGDINMYSNEKIYMHIGLFPESLKQNMSRINYKYFLKFNDKKDNKLITQIKNDPNFKDIRIQTLDDRNDNIGNITDRFYVFINFFNLVVFVLAFFIVFLSLETYVKKIKNTLGLLHIFGLKKIKIFYYNFLVLFLVFFISFLGAFLLNLGVLEVLSIKYSFFTNQFEAVSRGFLVMIILVFVGTFSPFYKIFKSDIISLLKDNNNFSNFSKFDYLLYLFLIFVGFLGVNIVSNITLFNGILYSLGFVGFIVFLYFFINIILNFIFNILKKHIKNFYLFDSIRSTIKPGNVSFLIIFSGIISFLSIIVFFVFSFSFLDYLKNITNTSNDTFVLNVQSDDLNKVNNYFSTGEIFEIVNLRILKVNGLSLKNFLNTTEVSREFSREFFSTTNLLENKIISGNDLKAGFVSVDKEFATRMGLQLGDEIVFSIAGLEKTLKIINFREALRNGTNPFFYFMLEKSDFINFPKNYILSYKESDKPQNLEYIMQNQVGNHLTYIKTKEIIDIVISITKQILLVVYLCLGYIFIFSILSFLVCIGFLKTFFQNKIKLLNILGGNKNKLIFYVNLQFLYLIFLSFLISLIFAIIILFLIFSFISYFSLSFLSFIYLIFGFLVFFVGYYIKLKIS